MTTVLTSDQRTEKRPTTPPSPPAPPSRRGKKGIGGKWIATVVLIAAAAAILYLTIGRGTSGPERGVDTFAVKQRTFNVTLNEKGEIEAVNSVDVKCEVEGRSTIIWLIPEGTEVKEGDLLVRLASNEIEDKVRAEQIKEQNARAAAEAAEKEFEIILDQNASDIRKAELALRNAQIELQKYVEGDFTKQKIEAEMQLNTAIKKRDQAKDILEDSEELRDKGFLTQREYEEDALRLYEAESNVRIAEVSLKTLLDYTHPKELEQKQSDVKEAEKELERTKKKAAAEEAKQRANLAARKAEHELTSERLTKLLEQQSKTEIRAPAPGLVVYETGEHRWNQREVAEGAEVFERQTIIKLPDTSRMMVKLRIHEAKTNKIALGQEALVEVEGLPGMNFKGEVTRIAPLADSQNSWLNPDLKEYDTEITLESNNVHELKPGVTARAEIFVRRVEDVLAIPVQAVFSSMGRTFAFVGKNAKDAAPVEIQIGHSSDKYVEVLDGLKPGNVVMLAANDTMLAKLPTQTGQQMQAGPPGEEDAVAKQQENRQRRGSGGRSGGKGHRS